MEMNTDTAQVKYETNDFVAYGSSGVCQILSQENLSFDGEHEEAYYKLCPIDGAHSTYYVPVASAATRLRPLLTKDEIYGLIDEMAQGVEKEWCSDSRERRGMFQNILRSDDYRQIIMMMRSLYQQQERRAQGGRKLAAADEAAMHAAETRMYQEFGIVLDIEPTQVHRFILDRLAAGENQA